MRIAVTGATGQLGSQVVGLLAAEPHHEIVAISRRRVEDVPQPARVSTAIADYGDPAALAQALRGVDTLVFISSDGVATKVLLHHDNVLQAAKDSGVGHIVALSGLDADIHSPFCYAVTYGHTERALAASGCAVSIARASIYTEFFLRFLLPARGSGQIRVPAAQGRISLISRTDVGRCLAALALAEPTGRHHDLTGPESLDTATMARIAASQWSRSVEYVDLTRSEHTAELARADEDPWWMYAFASMFDSIRDQRWTRVTDDVVRLTGRDPMSLRDVLRHETSHTRPPNRR